MTQNRAWIESTRTQLKQKDNVITAQETQIEELRRELAVTSEAKTQFERMAAGLQQQLHVCTIQFQDMYNQRYAQGRQDGAVEMNAKLQKAEEIIHKLNKDAEEGKRTLRQQVRQQELQLQQQQQQRRAPPIHLTQELKAAQEAVTVAKEELEKLRRRYDRQRGHLEATQTQVQNLQEQANDLNTKWQQSMDEKTMAYDERLKMADYEAQKQRRRVRDLKQEIEGLKQAAAEHETTINEQRAALASAHRLKRNLDTRSEDDSPVPKRAREPAEISPSVSSQQATPTFVRTQPQSLVPVPPAAPSDHALLYQRKLEALREAFTLYAVVAESAHTTRSKMSTTSETARVDCGDGSWFSFQYDVVTKQAPTQSIHVGRDTLFDDCLERLSKRSLNTMAKFVKVAFVRSDNSAKRRRPENATDEGGLVTEMFTLFFENLPTAGVPVKGPVAQLLGCVATGAVRLFDHELGFLFPAEINVGGAPAQVLPQTATFRSAQSMPLLGNSYFVEHLDKLWHFYEKIGKVYNQAIRQGHPIPELMLHPLLFHFLICDDDFPNFGLLTESAQTIAGWLSSFDEGYSWFSDAVLSDDYDQMIDQLISANIPTEHRVSVHEFHALQPFYKDAKRKQWLEIFVIQRIYQPRVGALRALRQGFQTFPIARHLSMFTWEEFKRTTIGVQEVSAEMLANIIDFNEASREFQTAFLDAIRTLSDEEVRNFLFFCTATRHLHETSTVQVVEDTSVATSAYPRAYTCFKQLRVPFQQGTTSDVILNGLRKAINVNRLQKFEYDEG